MTKTVTSQDTVKECGMKACFTLKKSISVAAVVAEEGLMASFQIFLVFQIHVIFMLVKLFCLAYLMNLVLVL